MQPETYCYRFSIAGLTFALSLPLPTRVTENFLPFQVEPGEGNVTVEFCPVQTLPPLPGEPVFTGVMYSAFSFSGGFARRYHEGMDGNRPYALGMQDFSGCRSMVSYLPGGERALTNTNRCFSHAALEEWFLHFGRLILHASLVDSPHGGLLFSGPSGVGKSTQAHLWERFGGGEELNGDKPILHCKDGCWVASGSPYAGSSRRHVQRTVPIRAIFFLEQGPACSLRRLGVAESFHKLYSGAVTNLWDSGYVSRLCDLLQALAVQVPAYHLICTPDSAAVDCVRHVLEE